MSADKVRVAMLSFAHTHADGYAKQVAALEDVELVAVWDRAGYGGKEAAKRLDVPFYSDLDALLARDDVDGVICNAPSSMHGEVLVPSAQAGKHIFTEKVLALTIEECDDIIDAVETAGVKLMVSLPSRCSQETLLAKKAVEDGILGDLHFGRGRVAHSASLGRWFKGSSMWFVDKELAGGGALFDLGCHRMDVIPWLMGIPKKVTAIINNFTNAYPIDDNSVTLIEFDNNAIGVVDVSWVHAKGPNPLELFGTEGSLVVGDKGVELQSNKLDEAGVERYLAERPKALPRPMEQWASAILRDTPMTISAQDGRLLTELMQAAYRSADTGEAVSLPI